MTEQAFEQLKKSVQQGDTSSLGLYVKSVAPDCIRQLQLKFGCTLDEAKDVFSDAYLKFHDLLLADKVKYGNIKGYIYIICRSLYIDQHSKKRNISKRKEVLVSHQQNEIENHLYQQEKTQNELAFNPLLKAEQDALQLKQRQNDVKFIRKALKQLHPRCRQLLTLAIVHKLRYAEIVEIMGFANTETVKSAKYNCLKKLKAIIKNTDK